MKFCIYCLALSAAMLLCGCSSTGKTVQERKAEQIYDELKKNSSALPAVWSLADCLRQAGAKQNWQIERRIIEDYFRLGGAQLAEETLLKELNSAQTADKKFEIQLRLTGMVKQRFQTMAALCGKLNIYPGSSIKVDFKMPQASVHPELPPLEDLEKAIVRSPYLKNRPVTERIKIFRQIYAGMIAAGEKYTLCQNNGRFPDAITAYADFCTQLHKICRLAGIKVEKYGSDLLQRKLIIPKTVQ